MSRPDAAILIQARSGSQRLPGKIFAPLPAPDGLPLIEHVYRRMQQVEAGLPVLLLLPEGDEAGQRFARERELQSMIGPEDDVRQRYRIAAQELGVEYIVRATGDNPAVDVEAARDALQYIRQHELDLFAWTGLPLGCGVEIFRSAALMQDGQTLRPEHLEHVSVHIKEDRRRFRVQHIDHPRLSSAEAQRLRVTVDEAADLSVVNAIFQQLGLNFGTLELLDLAQRQPELFAANSEVLQRKVAYGGSD
ncbi:MAG: hypothetical protein K1X75_02455 [Leptospirales bacterium]|nr:hypothetical protein [Leptospirales bacterium]